MDNIVKIKDGDFVCLICNNDYYLNRIISSYLKDNALYEYLKVDNSFEYDSILEYFNTLKHLDNIKLNSILKELKLKEYMDYKPDTLSIGIKCVFKIIYSLLKKPKILVINNLLDYMDYELKNKFIKFLKKYSGKEGITTLISTSCIDDIILFKKVILIDNKEILYCGSINKAFENISIWKKFGLPFMIELSNKLKYYELINKNYKDINKLVDAIWN